MEAISALRCRLHAARPATMRRPVRHPFRKRITIAVCQHFRVGDGCSGGVAVRLYESAGRTCSGSVPKPGEYCIVAQVKRNGTIETGVFDAKVEN
jgi:hypothetical protein